MADVYICILDKGHKRSPCIGLKLRWGKTEEIEVPYVPYVKPPSACETNYADDEIYILVNNTVGGST